MHRCGIACFILLAGAVGGASASAETLKVAIAQKGNWDTSIVDFGMAQGFFKQEGIDVEPTYTEGGASNEQAVISGSTDLAVGTGLLGIISAYVKGAPVRVFAAEMTGLPDLYFFARADRGIKSIKDATGKTIAYSNPGSSSNLATLALLRQAGIDATPVAAGALPAVFTQVMTGQVDIGHTVPPMGLAELQKGEIVVVARANDVPEIHDQTVRVNVANLTFFNAHRDVLVRFVRAYQKSLDWAFSDPKAIDYFAAGKAVSHELALEAFRYYAKSDEQPYEIKGLERTLADAYDFKRIPQPMKPEEVKDLFAIVRP
jgi:NitT/TauT family transport system substrate-binding protein